MHTDLPQAADRALYMMRDCFMTRALWSASYEGRFFPMWRVAWVRWERGLVWSVVPVEWNGDVWVLADEDGER